MRGAEYEIVVTGRLGRGLRASFPEFEVVSSGSDQTCLRGWVVDAAALHGTLDLVRDLNLDLVAVRRLDVA